MNRRSRRNRSGTRSIDREEAKKKGTIIFITKLPLTVTKEEVEDLFDRYGKIVTISIKKTYVFVVCSEA